MQFKYKEIFNEYNKLLNNSTANDVAETVSNLLTNITENEILKNEWFVIILYKQNIKDDVIQNTYEVCKPNQIIEVLEKYQNEKMKFWFKPFENN